MHDERRPMPKEGDRIRLLDKGAVVATATVHGYRNSPLTVGGWSRSLKDTKTRGLRELLEDVDGWFVNLDS
jgi:hypothetical protein